MHFKKKTFNNGILLKGVLISKLLNRPFASCSFKNLDFLIPQTDHFHCITNLLIFVLTILGFFSIFSTLYAISLHFIIIKLIVNLFFVLKILIY